MLRQFLPSVLEHTQTSSVDVVVADNGSTDGSLAFLQTQPVRIIQLDQNYGFTEGYNRAIAQVDADYVVLLNSDVEVTPHWLDILLEYMDSHPHTMAVQPKVISWHSQQDYIAGKIPAVRFEHAGAAGGMMDILGYPYCRGRILGYVEEDNGQYDSVIPIFWATGACFLTRTRIYRELGGLDAQFFAHQEEIAPNHNYLECEFLQSINHHVELYRHQSLRSLHRQDDILQKQVAFLLGIYRNCNQDRCVYSPHKAVQRPPQHNGSVPF
jgi:GT2 family glycosyltransferase